MDGNSLGRANRVTWATGYLLAAGFVLWRAWSIKSDEVWPMVWPVLLCVGAIVVLLALALATLTSSSEQGPS